MAKLTIPEKALLHVCKETLDSIIREWSNDIDADPDVVIDKDTRYRMKDRRMVDRAIGQMWAQLLSRRDNVFGDVKGLDRVEREAYHHAVNCYFRIYRGHKPGRPQSEDEAGLRKLLAMSKAGKSLGQIMIAFGLNPRDRTEHERWRGRLRTARKRFAEGGKNSRQ